MKLSERKTVYKQRKERKRVPQYAATSLKNPQGNFYNVALMSEIEQSE
jgi:hypothetical protein